MKNFVIILTGIAIITLGVLGFFHFKRSGASWNKIYSFSLGQQILKPDNVDDKSKNILNLSGNYRTVSKLGELEKIGKQTLNGEHTSETKVTVTGTVVTQEEVDPQVCLPGYYLKDETGGVILCVGTFNNKYLEKCENRWKDFVNEKIKIKGIYYYCTSQIEPVWAACKYNHYLGVEEILKVY